MSQIVEVTLGGQEVSVTIDGGNIGAGASVLLADLNAAVAEAEEAASEAAQSAADAEAAVASVPALIAGKADTTGGNIAAATFRSNLGLGGAATLNVGTVGGTVAAGNDSRIINAAQTDLSNVPSSALNAKSVTPTGGSPQPLEDALGLSVSTARDFYGTNQGTVATGLVTGKTTDRAFTGNAGGGTIYYGDIDRVSSQGSNAIASVRTGYIGLNLNSTGLITTAILNHGFVWKTGAGNVTNLRVWEGHVRHDGSGTVSVSQNFSISGITLGDSGATGTITQSEGYSSGEIGHNTLVDRAYDFIAGDGSPCVTRRVSFRSELQAHANKYAFQGAGTAQSAFGGWVAVGKNGAPLNALDVTTTVSDFSARLTNSHATTPWGVRIFFTAASPNNTTQSFLRCEDSVGTRLHIWSNGNIVNVNNSYGAISDERLKTEIEDAKPVLEKFAGRRFVTYRLKADVDGPRIHGVIAQDEAQHSPHLVTEGEDGFLSFNYAGLALETGQAVQELLAEVRVLQERVRALSEKS